MADPLKTRILKAIEDAVRTIPMVALVKRNPPTPPNRETAIYPVVFIYDDVESKVNNNRYSRNVFAAQFETYFLADVDNASDEADLIDCEIYKKVLTDPAILALINAIKPEEGNSSGKQYLEDFTGVLISRYTITYQHLWGDPTNQAK
jgi:hypothetical protein